MKKVKFLVIGLFLVIVGFDLQGCVASWLGGAWISTVDGAYTEYGASKNADKNIQQAYNPVLDTQKDYPTGTVDVVFEDLGFKQELMNVAYTSGDFVAPSGSVYFSKQTKQKVLDYAKQIMPNVNFVEKDSPDFNSTTPQIVFLPNILQHNGRYKFTDARYDSEILTQAILSVNGKMYLIDGKVMLKDWATYNEYHVLPRRVAYMFFYPILPEVKALLLKAQNQPLSPYLANWLNQVNNWQAGPIETNDPEVKLAFKISNDDPKLPCVYNYNWTYHKKDSKGKEYGEKIPKWYSNLQGIAPYLFMPEDSVQCQEIKKGPSNPTYAIMSVIAKNWEKETKPIWDNWDKYKNITVGVVNTNSTITNTTAGN